MTRPRTHRRTVTIVESDAGVWSWLEYGRTYRTLAAALRADARDAKRIAEAGRIVVTVRSVQPCSRAGLLVARALLEAGKGAA